MSATSLIFITGYLINIIANWFLISLVRKDKHIEGLSFQTQIIYAVATVSKCLYFYFTTLSEFWIGWIELLGSLGTSGFLIYCFYKYRRFSLQPETDFRFTYISVPICILLSVVVHPGFAEEGFDFPSMMIACSVSKLRSIGD